jgi:hypothetical protein
MALKRSKDNDRNPALPVLRPTIGVDPVERRLLALFRSGHSDKACAAGLLPTCASILLEYRQHRAKRNEIAMAIERRRVQACGAASVKKQCIGAIQSVTE